MANVGTGTAGKVLTATGVTSSSTFANIGTNSGLTVRGVVVAEGASAFQATAAGLNGQVLIGSNGANPAFGTITSSNGSIAFTSGPNSLDIISVGGGDVVGPAGATSTAIATYNGATGKIIQNSIPTIDSSGNILTSASLSGATLSIDVVNSSNTASSVARMSTTVGGSSAGDAVFQSSVSGGQVYTWGLDNSDSDAYVLASGVSLGTNNIMRASSSGEINYPLQPAFLAYVNTTISNVTGDATLYTIIFDTEVFDQNADFNLGTSTFTAPVTGRYQFNFVARVFGGVAISGTKLLISSSNRVWRTSMAAASSTTVIGTISNLIDMDASDTATFQVETTDSGGKIDDILGAAALSGEPTNFVSGYLVA